MRFLPVPAKQDGMHLDTKHKHVYSAALALLAEKKTVSVDQLYEKMQSSSFQMSTREIEHCLATLFQFAGSVQPVTVSQAFLFCKAALGYWKSGYAILLVKKDKEGEVLLYGLSSGIMTGHLIGRSADAITANAFLRGRGIAIEEWYPFAEYLRLLP